MMTRMRSSMVRWKVNWLWNFCVNTVCLLSPCRPMIWTTLGVVKTHRLVLSIPTTIMAPGVPDTPNQARVNIGPTALRNMLEHFPMNKGAKADPQLMWSFSNSEVNLKTCESSMDKGTACFSVTILITIITLARQGTDLDGIDDQCRRIWCIWYLYIPHHHCFSSSRVQCEFARISGSSQIIEWRIGYNRICGVHDASTRHAFYRFHLTFIYRCWRWLYPGSLRDCDEPTTRSSCPHVPKQLSTDVIPKEKGQRRNPGRRPLVKANRKDRS
jgi:hypothetical protein